jgi:hypothetical protein
MTRKPDFEIADIDDSVPNRKRKLVDIEPAIPTYDKSYEKLPMEASRTRGNLSEDVLEYPLRIFKHFLRDSDYSTFAQNTNTYASRCNAKQAFKASRRGNGRHWKQTNGPEMKVFIGILLYMGVHPIGSAYRAEYWSLSRKTPQHPTVYEAMGCTRFYQLCRYFKVSDLHEEDSLDMQAKDWWKKVDPLVTLFRDRAREALTPGYACSIDEILVECKGRSGHTLQIPSKSAGKGYKVYALCVIGYLYDFVFTSRTQKIAEVPDKKGVRQTSTMVKHLMQRLPNEGKGYCVYLDNFFSTVELFSDLKNLGIGACETCKTGSGIPKPLTELRGALTQAQWGYKKLMRAEPEETYYQKQSNGKRKAMKRKKAEGASVNCAVWQDMRAVQFLSTVHDEADFECYAEKARKRRKKITNYHEELREAPLRIPHPIMEYNEHMGYADLHAQFASYYSVQQTHFRVW